MLLTTTPLSPEVRVLVALPLPPARRSLIDLGAFFVACGYAGGGGTPAALRAACMALSDEGLIEIGFEEGAPFVTLTEIGRRLRDDTLDLRGTMAALNAARDAQAGWSFDDLMLLSRRFDAFVAAAPKPRKGTR